MRKANRGGMKSFDTLEFIKQSIARQHGDKIQFSKKAFRVMYGRNVVSAQMWEASQLRVGTVLRLARDVW